MFARIVIDCSLSSVNELQDIKSPIIYIFADCENLDDPRNVYKERELFGRQKANDMFKLI